eukprot:914463-Amorphochlora_amoeboformis.AAC.1
MGLEELLTLNPKPKPNPHSNPNNPTLNLQIFSNNLGRQVTQDFLLTAADIIIGQDSPALYNNNNGSRSGTSDSSSHVPPIHRTVVINSDLKPNPNSVTYARVRARVHR